MKIIVKNGLAIKQTKPFTMLITLTKRESHRLCHTLRNIRALREMFQHLAFTALKNIGKSGLNLSNFSTVL